MARMQKTDTGRGRGCGFTIPFKGMSTVMGRPPPATLKTPILKVSTASL
jgi:hypothetical protein